MKVVLKDLDENKKFYFRLGVIILILFIILIILYYLVIPKILEILKNKALSGTIIKEKVTNVFLNLLDIFGTPNKIPPRLKRMLKQVGDYEIVKMWACREIIPQKLVNLADIVCQTDIENRLSILGHDSAFHTYLILEIKSPNDGISYYKLHKTWQVTLEKISNQKPVYLSDDESSNDEQSAPQDFKINEKCMEVKMDKSKTLTVSNLIKEGERLYEAEDFKTKFPGQTFWSYDPQINNCQHFLVNLLESQGLLTTPLEQFIEQAAQDLVRNNQGASIIASLIASGANLLSNFDSICHQIR